ncbi:AAA family ATPase [Streptomyces sp. NPDC005408]|uniref:AAA family ATPase n=1 Tax=Streptomyces sp. NPDC005408 TaxID=3155341 RepID=UPI0033BB1B53
MRQRLLQRDTELGLLRKSLSGLGDGRPAVVVIQGPRGIGKTALLQAATELLPSETVVLRARCHPTEREFPYGVVRQLFDRSGPAAPPADAAPHDVLDGLFSTARSLAATRPVAVVVDDLADADELSLRWFAYLARRLDGLSVALLATLAPDAHDGLLAELGALSYTTLLRPGPLCDSCTTETAALALGGPLDPELAAACHILSQGNPLVLRELTDRLREESVSPGAPDLETVLRIGASTLSDTTLEWLHHRHPTAVELLTSLALLGPDADLPTAAVLTGQGEYAAVEAREALRGTGLLEPGPPDRFRHDLIRTAILSRLPAGERLDLHARAAALLARLGAPAPQTAEHLMALGTTGEPWTMPVLRSAARDAAAGQDWEGAARFLRRALAESAAADGDESGSPELTAELGAVELHRDLAACARYAAAVAGGPGGLAERARALLPLAHPALGAEGAAAVRPFAELATGLAAGGQRELLLPFAAQAALAGHRAGLHQAVRALGGSPDPSSRALLGALAAMKAAGGRGTRQARRLADRCVAGLSPADTGAAVLSAALAFAWTGAVDEAAEWSDRAVTAARGRAHPAELALALLVRADAAYRHGRWAASLGDAREAGSLAEAVRAPGLAAAAAGCAARALVRRSQHDSAAALLATAELRPDTHPLVRGVVLEARGMVALARGEHAAALDMFLECGHRLAARGIANPACIPWRSHAARCYEALGEPEAARTIAGRQEMPGSPGPQTPGTETAAPQQSGAAEPLRLSVAEQRVTDLVLRGFSNLETAEQLCLSKRTVDTHLGRIYRKLGIRGRPQLAAAVAALESGPVTGRTPGP